MFFWDVIPNPVNQYSSLVIGIVFLVIALILLGVGIGFLVKFLKDRKKK